MNFEKFKTNNITELLKQSGLILSSKNYLDYAKFVSTIGTSSTGIETVIAAIAENKLLGFTSYHIMNCNTEMPLIMVAKKCRNQGIGTELFLKTVEDIIAEGKNRLTISGVDSYNTGNFFLKFGAKIISTEPLGIGNETTSNYRIRDLKAIHENYQKEGDLRK